MYKIELLTEHHAVDSFNCGDENKNKFLQKYALQNSKGGLGRTYIAVKPGDTTKVYGYYTISSSAVKFESLPGGSTAAVLSYFRYPDRQTPHGQSSPKPRSRYRFII